jgi:hypothetical protein
VIVLKWLGALTIQYLGELLPMKFQVSTTHAEITAERRDKQERFIATIYKAILKELRVVSLKVRVKWQ